MLRRAVLRFIFVLIAAGLWLCFGPRELRALVIVFAALGAYVLPSLWTTVLPRLPHPIGTAKKERAVRSHAVESESPAAAPGEAEVGVRNCIDSDHSANDIDEGFQMQGQLSEGSAATHKSGASPNCSPQVSVLSSENSRSRWLGGDRAALEPFTASESSAEVDSSVSSEGRQPSVEAPANLHTTGGSDDNVDWEEQAEEGRSDTNIVAVYNGQVSTALSGVSTDAPKRDVSRFLHCGGAPSLMSVQPEVHRPDELYIPSFKMRTASSKGAQAWPRLSEVFRFEKLVWRCVTLWSMSALIDGVTFKVSMFIHSGKLHGRISKDVGSCSMIAQSNGVAQLDGVALTDWKDLLNNYMFKNSIRHIVSQLYSEGGEDVEELKREASADARVHNLFECNLSLWAASFFIVADSMQRIFPWTRLCEFLKGMICAVCKWRDPAHALGEGQLVDVLTEQIFANLVPVNVGILDLIGCPYCHKPYGRERVIVLQVQDGLSTTDTLVSAAVDTPLESN